MEIRDVLEKLGYNLRDSGEFWTTQAIYRGGDNPGALSIRKSNGVFVDFVTNKKGPLELLVKLTTGKSDTQVKEFLANLADFNNPEEEVPMQKQKRKKSYDSDILDRMLPKYDFFTNRGISVKTMEEFQVGFQQAGKLRNRYCFPIFDSSNKVIGFVGRWFKPEPFEGIPKYKNDGDKRSWVWPLHLSLPYIRETKQVILVESPNCIVSLWDAGVKNVLCLFGVSMGAKLLQFLLSEMELELIVIATNNEPDNNSRGNNAAQDIKERLDKYFDPTKSTINLPTKKDFALMSKTEILKWKDSNLLN